MSRKVIGNHTGIQVMVAANKEFDSHIPYGISSVFSLSQNLQDLSLTQRTLTAQEEKNRVVGDEGCG